jgi:hypothetical protein
MSHITREFEKDDNLDFGGCGPLGNKSNSGIGQPDPYPCQANNDLLTLLNAAEKVYPGLIDHIRSIAASLIKPNGE